MHKYRGFLITVFQFILMQMLNAITLVLQSVFIHKCIIWKKSNVTCHYLLRHFLLSKEIFKMSLGTESLTSKCVGSVYNAFFL